jgi:DNA polymerase-3 subunit epsilon
VSEAWVEGEQLAFDLETTGVDKFTDVPVSFALVTLRGGEVIEARHSLVDPGREIPAGASAIHGISTERARAEGIPLDSAIAEVTERLVDASRRGVPVVGFNLSYDLTMIDSCNRFLLQPGLVERGWSGPVLDPLVIDRGLVRWRDTKRTLGDLCDAYGVVNDAAHDAEGDAVAAGRLMLTLARGNEEVGALELAQLYERERVWHKHFIGGLNDAKLRKGYKGLEDHEFEWPLPAPRGTLF